MITFEHVSFDYPTPDGPRRALADVTLILEAGAVVALVGANGSGKTTLVRLCDGLLVPTSGRVLVDGLDTSDAGAVWDVRSRVGLVFQNPDNQIVGTLVEDDVAFGPENLGVAPEEIRERVTASLSATGLLGTEGREPHMLSDGQKQRLAIAAVLAMDPRYLALDEPTSMLDPVARKEVLTVAASLAREGGRGVLHVTHRLEDVLGADRVVVLEAGEVVFDGAPLDFAADDELVRRAGLALPAIVRVGRGLARMGLEMPVVTPDAESVVQALWP